MFSGRWFGQGKFQLLRVSEVHGAFAEAALRCPLGGPSSECEKMTDVAVNALKELFLSPTASGLKIPSWVHPDAAPIQNDYQDASDGRAEVAYRDAGRGLNMPTESELRVSEIAAAEARTDTKIVRLEGKLDLVLSKLDAYNTNVGEVRRDVSESRRAVITNAWVICATIVAVIIGLAAISPALIDFE